MTKPHRIAAGGLIFKNEAILLVRYRDAKGGTYLAGPGGALEEDENVVQAIIRETLEETGVRVQPKRVVIIEDLVASRFKMIKVWMTCDFVDGDVQKTAGAGAEGIVEAGWFTREQLARETVFPAPLMENDWSRLRSDSWFVECMPSQKAGF